MKLISLITLIMIMIILYLIWIFNKKNLSIKNDRIFINFESYLEIIIIIINKIIYILNLFK
jgi:hypothetical protein